MYSDPSEIKKRHKGDIPTLWKIYLADNPFYCNIYFIISVVLSLIISMVSLLSKSSSYDLIIKISNVALNVLPNLLGFNLGAYILIVGFGGIEILTVITKPLKGQSYYSFYQKLNGVLGIAVIVQIVSLVIFFFIIIWDEIQSNLIAYPHFFYFSWFPNVINFFGLFLIVLLATYSILLLITVIKHVFMFAQTIHLCIYTKSLKKKEEKEE